MKKSSPALEFALFVPVWFLMRFFQFAPLWAGKAVMKSLLALTYFVWGSRRRVTVEQLKILYPDAPDKKLEKLAFDAYMNAGMLLAENPTLTGFRPDNLGRYVKIKGFEIMKKAFDQGKGVLVPTAHYGGFEWANSSLAVKGLPVYSVIREVDNRFVDRFFDRLRGMGGVSVIKRERAAREIIKRIREGKVVTLATDQNAAFNGVFVKFLGKWASTVKAPAVVHLRTGAPIIPMYSVREDDGTLTVHILPEVKIKPSGDIKRDVFLITQKIADIQSEFIAEKPEQWFWLHKRWKSRPSDKELQTVSRYLVEKNEKQNQTG